MDFKTLQAFYHLSRIKSFKLVGEYLNTTQSNISRRIQMLESEYDITLFKRSTTGVTLTEDGEEFLELVNDIIINMDNINYKMKERKKKFIIQTSNNIACDLILKCIDDMNYSLPIHIITDPENKYYDIYVGPEHKKGNNEIILLKQNLFFSPHASEEYIRKNGAPLTIDDLRKHKIVLFDPFKSDFSQTSLKNQLEKSGIINEFIFTDSGSVELMMVEEGKGIGIIAEPYRKLRKSKIVPLQIEGIERINVPIYSIVNAKTYNNEKKLMSDKLVEMLKFLL